MNSKPQNSNTSTLKSTEELSSLMDILLTKAKASGATDAVVSVNHDAGFSVDVRMGQVETVAFHEDNGIGLTVYIGQRKGSASSTDISMEALDALVKAACVIAAVSAEDPCFGLGAPELMATHSSDLELYYPWDITTEKAIKLALSCESEAMAYDKRITNSDGVSVSTHVGHHGYANTAGAYGLMHSSRHGISCSLIASEGEIMQRDFDYSTARKSEDLTDPRLLAKSAAGRTLSRLNPQKLKTQKIPVLFSSRISSSLLSSFIAAISGSNLYRKHSFLEGQIGQQIFPDNIQIHEQPWLPQKLGSAFMDGDGVLTRNNLFIVDGILHQYALGVYTARKLGMETTGNSDGVHNLTIDPTAGDLPDLLKQMDKGLLVTEVMGQGVNILTGDYSRGASGFWVENGLIQYPVEGITIAGNLKSMFNEVVAVGNDWNKNMSTRCGSILIAQMTLAGA